MGIMDVLNGMQNGPSGAKEPGQGGMSPITMALLGLLAWKAVGKFSADHGGHAPTNTAGANMQPTGQPAGGGGIFGSGGLGGMFGGSGSGAGSSGGGGLGGLLGAGGGGLGGLLAGGAAGSVLSGGLSDIIEKFKNSGHGDVAQSWVGNGPNAPVSSDAIESALGDRLDGLAQRFGIPRDELVSGIKQHLPEVINALTPHGRVPNDQEMAQHI